MWLILSVVLVLPTSLGRKVESGCSDWRSQGSNPNVCCEKCQPGNRLVLECGPDPSVLCEPCAKGTYISENKLKSCQKCRECTEPQRVKTPCTGSSDTECECVEGFRCGDISCSFCFKVCGPGEEPANRDCQSCPAGKFNDQPHSHCKKWRERCPPDQQVVSNGTAISDIVCAPAPDPDLTTTAPDSGVHVTSPHSSLELMVMVMVFFVCLVICGALTVAVVSRQRTQKTPTGLDKDPVGLYMCCATSRRVMEVEAEHCSCCFPQEESGCSSAASLVSVDDNKPFELVV